MPNEKCDNCRMWKLRSRMSNITDLVVARAANNNVILKKGGRICAACKAKFDRLGKNKIKVERSKTKVN